ncbi:protein GLUTAMINE DUMPER 6-like [Chenopodium quinoa]|uniref:protein GLUTAMINE DUMPER 6-like n=1 Tax=Chenopodium quinoa TaxID=63459 RepID=UPI000B788B4B|nr:protein GLUTAMINE DUMPER 6-like [Chenopodium quinoa]
MRETNTTSEWRWNSPTPYLFCAVVLLMGLIATALLMLACSYRKRPVSPSTLFDGEPVGWETAGVQSSTELDTKPKFVVIMAGDEKPTFLAAPTQIHAVSSNHICRCDSPV